MCCSLAHPYTLRITHVWFSFSLSVYCFQVRAQNKEGITTASKSLGTGTVLQDKLDANLKTQGLQASTGVSDPFVNDPFLSNVSRIRAGVTTSVFTIVVTLFALHN